MGAVMTRDALASWVAGQRQAGRTIAFANGVFDMLHVGHVRYLEGARQEADVLVVAVNDDATVRMLKGPDRARAAGLRPRRTRGRAALRRRGRHLPEPTVTPLLELLRPDVHCKGTDYTVDSVARTRDGARLRRPHGHRRDPKDHSTRDLLRAIREGKG